MILVAVNGVYERVSVLLYSGITSVPEILGGTKCIRSAKHILFSAS